MEPALTAEEWAESLNWWEEPGNPRRMYGEFSESDPAWEHKLAALALHGQPFGFTWADVDALLSVMLVAENECVMHTGEEIDTLRTLAERIAALLPPRAPEET